MNATEEVKQADLPATTPRKSAVTCLSVFFGLLGAVLMSGFAGMHDSVYTRGPLMIGNHMPGGAFTYMMFIGIVWNGLMGLLGRWRRLSFLKRLALDTRELVVVMMMTLVACFPPTSGLFRYFHRLIMLPWYYVPGRPDWVENGVLQSIQTKLFPSPAPYYNDQGLLIRDERVYMGIYTGLAQGTHRVALWNLPLSAWWGCLSYWAPLVFLLCLCVISMQFVVHRQWAHHEQLGYPVAQVASRFCWRADGRRGIPDIFRNRLFWWGLVPVLSLYALMYLNAWFPHSVPPMSEIFPDLKYWGLPTISKIPALKHSSYPWPLTWQGLYFTIVGLSYFVSTEISLTMGVSVLCLNAVSLAFFYSTGLKLASASVDYQRAGSYIGYTLILIYTGRTYFKAVFGKALFWRKGESADRTAVLAARVLVVAFAGFVAVFDIMGAGFFVALFYSLALLMFFLVFSRIVCETGIPFVQASFGPSNILLALFGPQAIGPTTLPLLLWVNSILAIDPRECLMPYVATGVKVADDNHVRMYRAFGVIVASVFVAIVIAYFSSSYTLYNFNAMSDSYASVFAPTESLDEASKLIHNMKEVGDFDAGVKATGFGKLKLIHADPQYLKDIVIGVVLVIACSALRFRFSKFPIHPVLFLIWGTYPSNMTWWSFLVGWFVKTLVVRFGGGGVYQKLKPLFVGLVAGELLAVGLNIAVNLAYLWIFNVPTTQAIGILPN